LSAAPPSPPSVGSAAGASGAGCGPASGCADSLLIIHFPPFRVGVPDWIRPIAVEAKIPGKSKNAAMTIFDDEHFFLLALDPD
jgi:hypothetical protein